ncbi:FtsK/SpoIIIE domain-containing protein [uncultured Jatrophihabitans sp.]|uniref:FtsK/SpoIIIE domain-containing protein n=1 Tax=uncultured Jatrophihabitans sp. TaxID=1610747 RepID=UPI0035CC528C
MQLRITLEDGANAPVDCVLDAPDDLSVADLTGRVIDSRSPTLLTHRRAGERIDGATVLDPDASLAACGLTDGAIVGTTDRGLAPAGDSHTAPRIGWLEIILGADTGRRFEISADRVAIGRAPDNDIVLAHGDVSRYHATVTRHRGAITLADTSTNGVLVDNVLVENSSIIHDGSTIVIGGYTLRFRAEFGDRPGSRPATLTPDGKGGLILDRTPSLRTSHPPVTVDFPRASAAPATRKFPWIMAVVPLVFAGVIFAVTRQPTFLLFGLLSPVTIGANMWSTRRTERQQNREKSTSHRSAVAAAETQLTTAIELDLRRREECAPTTGLVRMIAGQRLERLWERSPQDEDFLQVRLGTGRVAATVQIAGDHAHSTGPVHEKAPLVTSLRNVAVTTISGSEAGRDALLRSVGLQLAALHTPEDVRLVGLSPQPRSEVWEWFRWLPHSWLREQRAVDLARTDDQIHNTIARLRALIDDSRSGNRATAALSSGTFTVVLIDDTDQRITQRRDVADLLDYCDGSTVSAVVIARDQYSLPEQTRIHLDVGPGILTMINRATREEVRGVPEGCTAEDAVVAARSLTPLRRPVTGRGAVSQLPRTVSLYEVFGQRPDSDWIATRWAEAEPRPAMFGMSDEGPLGLDFADQTAHALIGGTVGAGKSDLLQSWILAAACNRSPDDLNFLFVEFKGLSAFRTVRELPHCVATLTNLTLEMTTRALDALRIEAQTRQRLFEGAGAIDLRSYRELRQRQPDLEPIPRLVIALDEFAELKDALPDFIPRIVSMARAGRSLGIHLVLATQQVGRAVTADISSNAAIRVSLRAGSVEDSIAVIENRDAARIPMDAPGRALVRVGDRPPVLIQSGWSRAPLDHQRLGGITLNGWCWSAGDAAAPSRFASSAPGPTADPSAPAVAIGTEANDLVSTIRATSDMLGYRKRPAPFTDLLPGLVPLASISPGHACHPSTPDVADGPGPVVGQRDDLTTRTHPPYRLPLVAGNVAIIGAGGSGRTTALRTAALSWAQELGADRLHIHAIDGARGLQVLTALPHTGTVVGTTDSRAVRLLGRLVSEIDRRVRVLDGYGNLSEYNLHFSEAPPLPRIVLIIDHFEELVPAESSPLTAPLERILRTGSASGVTVLAAGDDVMARPKWLARFPHRLVLRDDAGLTPAQYGLSHRVTLTGLSAGRGFESAHGSQVQVAVIGGTAEAPAQNDALRELASQLDSYDRSGHAGPLRIQDLPEEVSSDALAPPARGIMVLGLGDDEARPVELGLEQFPVLITGPGLSGRTTALLRIGEALNDGRRRLTVLAGAGTPFAALTGATVIDPSAAEATDWTELLDDPDDVVLVEDLHGSDLPDALVHRLESGPPRCLFAATHLAGRFPSAAIKALARAGTLLYLRPDDAVQVRNFELGINPAFCVGGPRGRAIIVQDGRTLPIQLANR